jgi:hypothetical protein
MPLEVVRGRGTSTAAGAGWAACAGHRGCAHRGVVSAVVLPHQRLLEVLLPRPLDAARRDAAAAGVKHLPEPAVELRVERHGA